MNYLLWPVGASKDAPPLYEMRRPILERHDDGEPRLTGEFRSPAFPEILDHRWISFGTFRLSDYVAVPWPELRERLAA